MLCWCKLLNLFFFSLLLMSFSGTLSAPTKNSRFLFLSSRIQVEGKRNGDPAFILFLVYFLRRALHMSRIRFLFDTCVACTLVFPFPSFFPYSSDFIWHPPLVIPLTFKFNFFFVCLERENVLWDKGYCVCLLDTKRCAMLFGEERRKKHRGGAEHDNKQK